MHPRFQERLDDQEPVTPDQLATAFRDSLDRVRFGNLSPDAIRRQQISRNEFIRALRVMGRTVLANQLRREEEVATRK